MKKSLSNYYSAVLHKSTFTFEKIQKWIDHSPFDPFVDFIVIFVRRWGEDACPVKAAAMAFFGLLSIFPIILAGVSILATVMAGNDEVLKAFGNFVAQFFPGQAGNNVSEAVAMAVYHIASGPNAASLGVVALLSLLWSGRAYFSTLAEVLNRVWPQAIPRSFFQQQLVLGSMFLAAGLLGLLSMLSTLVLQTAKSVMTTFPVWFINSYMLLNILSHVLSWSFAFLMFLLLYWFLPHVEERQRRLVFAAALIATIAWEIAKYVFSAAVGKVLHYEATYGAVAGVVVTLVWIYFASMILLLAAEIAAAWDEMWQKTHREILDPELRGKEAVVKTES